MTLDFWQDMGRRAQPHRGKLALAMSALVVVAIAAVVTAVEQRMFGTKLLALVWISIVATFWCAGLLMMAYENRKAAEGPISGAERGRPMFQGMWFGFLVFITFLAPLLFVFG
jgi:hypothetical protein